MNYDNLNSEEFFDLLKANNVKTSICFLMKKMYELKNDEHFNFKLDVNTDIVLLEWLLKNWGVGYAGCRDKVHERFKLNDDIIKRIDNDDDFNILMICCALEELDKFGLSLHLEIDSIAYFTLNKRQYSHARSYINHDVMPVTKADKDALSLVKERVKKALLRNQELELMDIDNMPAQNPIQVVINEVNQLTINERNMLIKADPTLRAARNGVIYYVDDIVWSNIYHELLPLIDDIFSQ